ncbi:hypothetical protein PLESTM_001402100 [Pleodorina starrii]|nr:hypothetical protein PLESTM_001402100 [Pleodorina starrii]
MTRSLLSEQHLTVPSFRTPADEHGRDAGPEGRPPGRGGRARDQRPARGPATPRRSGRAGPPAGRTRCGPRPAARDPAARDRPPAGGRRPAAAGRGRAGPLARARAPRVAATPAAAAGRPRPWPAVPPDQDAARPGRRQKTGPKAFKN